MLKVSTVIQLSTVVKHVHVPRPTKCSQKDALWTNKECLASVRKATQVHFVTDARKASSVNRTNKMESAKAATAILKESFPMSVTT